MATTIIVPDDKATIALAMAACSADDTIHIRANTYTEGDLHVTNANLTIQPFPGDEGSVYIEYAVTGKDVFYAEADNAKFLDLSIKYSGATTYSAAISTSHLVSGVEVHRLNIPTGHTGYAIDNACDGLVVDRLYQLSGYKCISQVSAASGASISNVIGIVDNDGVISGDGDDISNVLIVGTSAQAFDLTTACTVRNCIAYGGTGGDGFWLNHALADVDYCLAYGASFANLFKESLASKGANCRTDDPLFVGGGDYHPTASSPTNGKGVAVAGVTEDIEGNPRVLDDIGPYASAVTVTAAVHAGQFLRVLVTLNANITGVGLDDPAKWTVTAPLGGSAVTVSDADESGATGILLTLSSQMDADTVYRATAISLASGSADFITPLGFTPDSEAPFAATDDGMIIEVDGDRYSLMPSDPDAPTATLRDALLLSLFSDRRAAADDVLPDGDGPDAYKGGFWADSLDGDEWGSRLWLLARLPVTDANVRKTEDYARESLEWMITDGLATAVSVTATRTAAGAVSVEIEVTREDGTVETERFADLWEGV